jgi:neurofibromin 1
MFLRFFNPALVAPDSENLCKPINNPKIRRALLLVTKIVQNLANDIVFRQKEPYLMIMNDFLTEHINQMKAFLEEISVCYQVFFNIFENIVCHTYFFNINSDHRIQHRQLN